MVDGYQQVYCHYSIGNSYSSMEFYRILKKNLDIRKRAFLCVIPNLQYFFWTRGWRLYSKMSLYFVIDYQIG